MAALQSFQTPWLKPQMGSMFMFIPGPRRKKFIEQTKSGPWSETELKSGQRKGSLRSSTLASMWYRLSPSYMVACINWWSTAKIVCKLFFLLMDLGRQAPQSRLNQAVLRCFHSCMLSEGGDLCAMGRGAARVGQLIEDCLSDDYKISRPPGRCQGRTLQKDLGTGVTEPWIAKPGVSRERENFHAKSVCAPGIWCLTRAHVQSGGDCLDDESSTTRGRLLTGARRGG